MTTAQIKQALRKAHDSGDAESASRLAKMLAAQPEYSLARERATAFAQGGTFGFADELRGALGAGLERLTGMTDDFGQRYRELRDLEREQYAAYQADRPMEAAALEMTGGLVTGAAGGARAAGTNLGRRAAASIAARPFAQRAAIASGTGALGGGAGGALAGAGAAQELSDVPGQALQAGATGAGLGAAFGLFAEPVISLAQKAGGAALRTLMPEPDVRAGRAIRTALERQGQTPQAAMGRMAALGPGATLADTGEATRHLLDSMASQPGSTGELAGRQLARRSRMQIDELTDAIGQGRAMEAVDASKQLRQTQASPLYEQAFAEGVPHTEVLEGLFARPSVQKAWNAAKRRGRDISGIDPARLGDARPSLEGWQATKEALDDQVGALMRAGRTKQANEIRDNILTPLLEELDAASPTYAQARQIWAGSKAFDDAVEAGGRFVNEPSSVTERTLSRLSEADKEGFKIGAVQAIQDRLERQGWTHDNTKLFRTPSMERKLRALLGTDEYADFMNRLEASRVKQQTFGAVGKGSATSRREAFREDESMTRALQDFGVDLLTGQSPTVSAVNRGAQLLRNLPVGGTPEAARDLIGGGLLQTDPAAVQAMLMRAYGPPTPIQTTGAGLLPAVAGLPIGIGAGLLGTSNQ